MRSSWDEGIRRAMLALAIAAMGSAVSCFETQPVRERIDIFFHDDGAAEVAITTSISADAYNEENPRLRERVSRVGEDLVRGEEPWSRGIREAAPVRERRTYEFDKGNLSEAVLEALVESPEDLPRLFENVPIGTLVTRDGSRLTLEFAPSRSSRAPEREERRLREATDAFAASMADYLESLAALYDHLEAHPESARACFAKLLGVSGEEEGISALTESESSLTGAAEKAANAMIAVLTVPQGEAFTHDEISQLVFDPFPGPVTVEITGRVEAVAGFLQETESRFSIPQLGLWAAIESLQDRWVSPLPVVEAVRVFQESEETGEEPDEGGLLEQVLSNPRHVESVPRKSEILSALEAAMRPEESYKIEWRLPPDEEEEGSVSAQ